MDMDYLILALDSVSKEKGSFIKLRELQSTIQKHMGRSHDMLWLLYMLNDLVENFFYSIEGVDLTDKTDLKNELETFRHLFSDLGKTIRAGNLADQVKCVNKIIESYINITNLS